MNKQETLEEVCNKINFINPRERVAYYNGLKNGAKWQQEQGKNRYSEEEVKELLKMYRNSIVEVNPVDIIYLDKWFKQFKKN